MLDVGCIQHPASPASIACVFLCVKIALTFLPLAIDPLSDGQLETQKSTGKQSTGLPVDHTIDQFLPRLTLPTVICCSFLTLTSPGKGKEKVKAT